MAQFLTINTVAGAPAGAAIEGFEIKAIATLAVTVGAGLVDGVEVDEADLTITAATTTFLGYLVSSDGAGSALTVTETADDVAATAELAMDAAEALAVPAGEVALFVGAADATDADQGQRIGKRGDKPAVSADF